jgi:excinuclease ABC subunit A
LEALPVEALRRRLSALALARPAESIAAPAKAEALERLGFLEEVGLGYLALGRGGGTLSGGELRRARLAAACAARMSGLLYLLDEPTAGLHPSERPALRRRLRALVEEGNTVVCVEHDPETLREADWVVELGPGSGADGGRLLASGPAAAVVAEARTPTARALARPLPPARTAPRREGPWVRVREASHRNLRAVTVEFPASGLTCVTGVSGAGKSTLVIEVLAPAARARLDGTRFPRRRLRGLDGTEAFDRVSAASGAPSRHPRATPGSVLGILPPLREVYAATLEARARGWGPARFSPNLPGGRCDACRGTGERRVALRDLPEVRVPCETCGGRRFAVETERVRVKGLSIADVLALTVARAAEVFRDLPRVGRPLAAAAEVGLGYLPLGEPTSRLSGGEALRLRLAAALGRGGRTRTLYLLDEPTAGLHPDDAAALLALLLRLAAEGNAVVAVEHHPLLIREADHLIELGPGPGDAGGRLVYAGPPAGIARVADSPTGRLLR